MLENLNISHSGLTGSLPPWGSADFPALQQLTTLTLQGNNLTGTVPASWANLKQLSRITLYPGNPGLCGHKPGDASFKVCHADDQLLCRPVASDDALCTALGSTGGSGSSFPVAAVAVPVAVVGALTIAAGGFLVWRKKQQQAAIEPSSTASAVYKASRAGVVC